MASARRRAAVAVVPDLPEPAPRPGPATDGQGVLLPALVPDVPPAPERVLVPLGRFRWEKVIRWSDLPPMTKLVALTAATYADADGTRVRPGERGLGQDCGIGQSTARKHLAALVAAGLLEMVSRGGGPNGTASEYRLVAPAGTPLASERSSSGPKRRKRR